MSVPKKEVDFLAHPPSGRWRWQWRCGWLEGEKEGGMGFPRGELASPQASLSAPHPPSLLVLLALFVNCSLFPILYISLPSSVLIFQFPLNFR